MCLYGQADTLEILINESESRNIRGLDFNLKDSHGDTPLNLCLSRGYVFEEEMSSHSSFLKNRRRMVDLLLPRTNTTFCHRPGTNNPLHWCFFYGDLHNGERLFEKRPVLLLEHNQLGETPFEFLFKKKIKVSFYESSYKLTKHLVVQFARKILEFLETSTPDKFLNSSDTTANQFYYLLEQIKHLVDKEKIRGIGSNQDVEQPLE